ncbi:MAG: FHA domain-containing protein [Lachnospiraceae bacterium]|nr:FHA domain-containing protein [Lachnospiraceae bacterium]
MFNPSKNGTYVNEKLLAPNEVVEVFDGDIIVISKYKYCLHLA